MFLIKINGARVPEAKGFSFEGARDKIHQAMVTVAGGALWGANREISVKFMGEHSTKEDLITAEIDCLYTDVLSRSDEFTTALLEKLCQLFEESDVLVLFKHDGRTLSQARASAKEAC